MTKPKFQMGDRIENIKNRRTGFVRKQRGEGVYLVSVRGFGECEWNEADMVKVKEPPRKRDHTFNRHV